MKFTEGYWEKNERANASYAMQAFTAEAIPGGMRIVSPFREINDRGGALDVGTITTEFTSVRKDIISVRSYHYQGYIKGEPRYELNEDPQETEVEITDAEAVMKAGRMTVRVDLKDFNRRRAGSHPRCRVRRKLHRCGRPCPRHRPGPRARRHSHRAR